MNTDAANTAASTDNDFVMDALLTSTGKAILVPAKAHGRDTGYAYIGNPYFLPPTHPCYDPYHRLKDGDTVIACEKDDWRAMPVADAYYKFREESDEAYLEYLMEMDRFEAMDRGEDPCSIVDYSVPAEKLGDPKPLTFNPFAGLSL